MTGSADAPLSPLDAALRRTHWSVLGLLAVCAVVIATAGPAEPASVPPPRPLIYTAVGFAAFTILARQFASSPRLARSRRAIPAVVSLASGAALGLTGVVAALLLADRGTGLGLVLGAAILSLRPPPRVGPASA